MIVYNYESSINLDKIVRINDYAYSGSYYLSFYDGHNSTNIFYEKLEDAIYEHNEIIEAYEADKRTYFLNRSISKYKKEEDVIIQKDNQQLLPLAVPCGVI